MTVLVLVWLECFGLVDTLAVEVLVQVPTLFVLQSTGLVGVVVRLGALHVVEVVHHHAQAGVGAASADCVGLGLLARDVLEAGLGIALHCKEGVHTLSLVPLVLLFVVLVRQLPLWSVKKV